MYMFSKNDLIRSYEDIDFDEPIKIIAYENNGISTPLEVPDNEELETSGMLFYQELSIEIDTPELKLKLLPFIFAYFKHLQSAAIIENYHKDKSKRKILSCDMYIYQDDSESIKNWECFLNLIKKNKELYHFSLTLEEYRKKIAFICIDFIMKKGK